MILGSHWWVQQLPLVTTLVSGILTRLCWSVSSQGCACTYAAELLIGRESATGALAGGALAGGVVGTVVVVLIIAVIIVMLVVLIRKRKGD